MSALFLTKVSQTIDVAVKMVPIWRKRAQKNTQATQPPVFFSAIEGLLPVAVSAPKGPTIAIYTTHDGGATWNTTTMIPVQCAWDFLTMQQGWVVGANGTTLFETNNGGRLWTMMIPSANFRHISQLDFVSAHEGWVISSTTPAAPTLLKTTDGGQTWAQVSPTPTPFAMSRVDLTVNPTSITGRLGYSNPVVHLRATRAFIHRKVSLL